MINFEKIQKAYYTNEECDTVCIEWMNDEEAIEVFHTSADDSNSYYISLQNAGWDHDRLAVDTAEFRRAGSAKFSRIVNAAVNERVDEIMKKYNIANYSQYLKNNESGEHEGGVNHEKMWDTLLSINESKEDIFAFKMWAMQSKLAEKATQDQKKALRRSSSILEGLSVLYLMQ